MNHPTQPLFRDKNGTVRFHANGVVQRIVDEKIADLGEIPNWVRMYPGITQDDIDQFYQLIGYSVGGYSELAASEVVSGEAADRAESAGDLL